MNTCTLYSTRALTLCTTDVNTLQAGDIILDSDEVVVVIQVLNTGAVRVLTRFGLGYTEQRLLKQL